jgi:hypothetical protein
MVLAPAFTSAGARRLRPAVSEVAFLDDQYAQIAYRIGYEHRISASRGILLDCSGVGGHD